jgi:putative SOS response-associated peptidase YedK
MCNLYRIAKSVDEIARLFGVRSDPGANLGEEVYPGYPGLVIADGRVRAMTWGFPLALKGEHGQPLKPKPVNNTRSDKLTSSFWRASFVSRRCLVPMTAFAEAEGARGRRNRYSLVQASGATARNGGRSIPSSSRRLLPRFGKSMIACPSSSRPACATSGFKESREM